MPASPKYMPWAETGPRSRFIHPQRHFVNNEKINIYEKFVDLVEVNVNNMHVLTFLIFDRAFISGPRTVV